jgi:hypothetical protein
MKKLTLPSGMSHDGDASLDELPKHEQSCLDCALHGADDDQADVKVFWDAGDKFVANLPALIPAEFGQFGVMEAVVLCGELAGSNGKE